MSEFIKAGDLVKVVNWGHQYPRNIKFFTDHRCDIDMKWMIRYAYNNALFSDKKAGDIAKRATYKVLYADAMEDKYVITATGDSYASVYLMGGDGLKKAPRKMTQDDIQTELGYEVELIGEWYNE